MKRKLLWCLALTSLMATTSCSQDETVDEPTPQRHAIGFSSFVDKATRADVTNSSFLGFQVWAYESPKDPTAPTDTWLDGNFILNNVTYSRANNTSPWGYADASQTAYWRPGSKYTFLGVGPAEYVTKTGGTSESGLIINVDAKKTAPANPTITFINRVGTVDLVAALNDTYATTPWQTGNSTVAEMKFDHLLTRIHFAFTNKMGDGSTIQISDVQITDAPIKGSASVSKDADTGKLTANWVTAQGELDPQANDVYSNLRFGGATIPLAGVSQGDTFENTSGSGSFIRTDKTAQTINLLVIPVNTITFHVSFNITHKKGDLITTYPKKDIAITMPEGGWKTGYCYLLTAEITSKNISDSEWVPITFNPTVNDWEEAGQTTLTVPDANNGGTSPSPVRRR